MVHCARSRSLVAKWVCNGSCCAERFNTRLGQKYGDDPHRQAVLPVSLQHDTTGLMACDTTDSNTLARPTIAASLRPLGVFPRCTETYAAHGCRPGPESRGG